MDDIGLMTGEVRTALLQNSSDIGPEVMANVLAILPGESVRTSLRPISYALSPELLTGVDCRLRTAKGGHVLGVGTAFVRAAVTGGRVLQGSCYATLAAGPADHRLPWSHYLSRPGRIEIIGKAGRGDLAGELLAGDGEPDHLDLGAVSGRIIDRIQTSGVLDRRAPFRMPRTRLAWVLETTADRERPPELRFVLVSKTLRTLHLVCSEEARPAVVSLCEDLALHDWLLTSLLALIAKAGIGSTPGAELSPMLHVPIDHLLHLWMPGAHLDQSLQWPWEALERYPGFTRQWQSSVNRIRDQVAVHTLALLSGAMETRRG